MRPAAIHQGPDRVGEIRVGVGGWTYEPWRGLFFPGGVTREHELEYASRRLSSIEIDGTYYGTQKRESFVRWREATPDDFVFSIKGPRFATNRRVLAQAGESVERFMNSGVTELRGKLGPILWQMLPAKSFVQEDFAAFLELLPKQHDGLALRHAVELRHPSFACAATIEIARERGIAIVLAGDSKFPEIAAFTAPFVYLRIMGSKSKPEQGYSNKALDVWAERARDLAAGKMPDGLERFQAKWMPVRVKKTRKNEKPEHFHVSMKHENALASIVEPSEPEPRDVFVYFIAGHKAHNPAAAQALMKRLS